MCARVSEFVGVIKLYVDARLVLPACLSLSLYVYVCVFCILLSSQKAKNKSPSVCLCVYVCTCAQTRQTAAAALILSLRSSCFIIHTTSECVVAAAATPKTKTFQTTFILRVYVNVQLLLDHLAAGCFRTV